jgi:putative membrane protein
VTSEPIDPSRYEQDEPDPGLAAERTDLAWNRSGLALLGLGVAVMRGLAVPHLPAARSDAGAMILVLGALVWLLGAITTHRRLRPGHAHEPATRNDLAPIALGVAVIGVAAFALAALRPG